DLIADLAELVADRVRRLIADDLKRLGDRQARLDAADHETDGLVEMLREIVGVALCQEVHGIVREPEADEEAEGDRQHERDAAERRQQAGYAVGAEAD